MELIIKNNGTTSISEGEKVYSLGSTGLALGNLISVLEEMFPSKAGYGYDFAAAQAVSIVTGKQKSKRIWNMYEDGSALYFFNSVVGDEDYITVKLRDIEKLRISQHITKTYLPLSAVDPSEGWKVSNVKSVREVVFFLLYFYAYNDLILIRCQHCGRWFTGDTKKLKYCPRLSTFSKFTHLTCAEAVHDIWQDLNKRKVSQIRKTLDRKMSGSLEYYKKINEFERRRDDYVYNCKLKMSVENLKEYGDFLKEELNNAKTCKS